MNQIRSFNTADTIQNMVQQLKGRQNTDNLSGLMPDKENPQGMSDFREMLLGRQPESGMTKEQEQTLEMAAAGMQQAGGLIFAEQILMPEAQTAVIGGVSVDMAVTAVDIQPVQMTDDALNAENPGADTAVTEVIENTAALDDMFSDNMSEQAKPVQVTKMAEGQPTQLSHIAVKGQKTVQEDTGENTENLLKTSERVPEEQELKETTSEVRTLNWQETLLNRQGIVTKAAEPQAHEVVKVNVPEEIMDNLAHTTVEKVRAGVRAFEIQIEPENLGKIAVKVEYHNGSAMISIVCSETKTLELLKNHADDLGAMIQKNLQQETIVYVDETKAEAFEQQGGGNSDAGRESEWERHKEERQRRMRRGGSRFLQELRLGLLE